MCFSAGPTHDGELSLSFPHTREIRPIVAAFQFWQRSRISGDCFRLFVLPPMVVACARKQNGPRINALEIWMRFVNVTRAQFE